ncbi:MAG: hypothetical protein EBU70_10435 [Actinobacteria bacterium]|nr:hypothetical protein [Actinomycetota bacterium]
MWNWRVTNGGQVVGSESFNAFAGAYTTVTGNLGGIDWTASAPAGVSASGGYLSSSSSDDALTFSFAPGVRAVAGNIFGTDAAMNPVTCVVTVTLSNGTAYEGFTSGPGDFVGFYSSTANIASLSIAAVPMKSGDGVFATIDNLYLAVPAPGAAALLGLAGVLTRRRRDA